MCIGIWGCRGRTGVCVPFVLVVRALLFADELLVHDFFELDHFGVCGMSMCGWEARLARWFGMEGGSVGGDAARWAMMSLQIDF